jgi:hypothetical protein
MKVESKLIVIAVAAICAFSAAASLSRLPTCSVWLRNVSASDPNWRSHQDHPAA